MTLDTGPAVSQDRPAPLTLGDFKDLVGTSFAIVTDAGTQDLLLAAATEIANSSREGGGFRLEFAGPPAPRLPQAIYAFPIGDVPRDIFIVAIGVKDGGIRYEAIFF